MGLYSFAINEYTNENDEGKHKLVYSYFGLAVYFSQVLEETFSIMLWSHRIIEKQVTTNQEVNLIIDEIEKSRHTMGMFINEVKKSYKLSEKIEKKLSDTLQKRNYIVHKYFKLNIEKFASEIGKKEMLLFFCDFIDIVQPLIKELDVHYEKYLLSLNITENQIKDIVIKMKEKEKIRDSIE